MSDATANIPPAFNPDDAVSITQTVQMISTVQGRIVNVNVNDKTYDIAVPNGSLPPVIMRGVKESDITGAAAVTTTILQGAGIVKAG